MKKCFATLLICAILFSLCLSTGVAHATVADANRLAVQQQSMELFSNLVKELEIKETTRISPHLPVMPEYYCGAYLDPSGHLNLMLKEEAPSFISTLSTTSSNSTVQTHTALYSFNDLNRSIEAINANLNSTTIAATDFVSCYLDEARNRVIVELRELTSEKQDAFENLIHKDSCLIFESAPIDFNPTYPIGYTNPEPISENEPATTSSVPSPITVTLGERIWMFCTGRAPDGVLYGHYHALSIGMGATLNTTQRGFFTAAHGVKASHAAVTEDGAPYTLYATYECYLTPGIEIDLDDENVTSLVNANRVYIGRATPSQVLLDSTSDSAFVVVDSNVTVSPHLLNGASVCAVAEASDPPTDIYGNVMQGAAVVTCGATTKMTGSAHSGHVLSVNESCTASEDGFTTTNTIMASTKVDDGDSGGTLAGEFIPPIYYAFYGLIKAKGTRNGAHVSFSIPYSMLKYYYAGGVSWNVAPLS